MFQYCFYSKISPHKSYLQWLFSNMSGRFVLKLNSIQHVQLIPKVGQSNSSYSCMARPGHSVFSYFILQILIWRRQWHPTPVLLPGKSRGQRSLVDCGPWGPKESDRTERLHFHFSLSRIGEGNGNPLQCSCLENPRDGGAWLAAVYGVAQSWTRLKRLTSSSSSSRY